MTEHEYIHGYSPREQERLVRQARFLAPAVFRHVDFSDRGHIVEIGCGVGAQTEILFERFPGLRKITGVDREARQIQVARARLDEHARAGRFEAVQGDAAHLPFASGQIDGAFVCWVLEHTPDPLAILREIQRVVAPGGAVHLIEVQHDTLRVEPRSESIHRAWQSFGDGQIRMGGDPFVGDKLPGWLTDLGYRDVRPFHVVLDSREYPERGSTALWDYFLELIETSYGTAGLPAPSSSPDDLRLEFERLKSTPGAYLRYSFVSVSATPPRAS